MPRMALLLSFMALLLWLPTVQGDCQVCVQQNAVHHVNHGRKAVVHKQAASQQKVVVQKQVVEKIVEKQVPVFHNSYQPLFYGHQQFQGHYVEPSPFLTDRNQFLKERYADNDRIKRFLDAYEAFVAIEKEAGQQVAPKTPQVPARQPSVAHQPVGQGSLLVQLCSQCHFQTRPDGSANSLPGGGVYLDSIDDQGILQLSYNSMRSGQMPKGGRKLTESEIQQIMGELVIPWLKTP